MKLRFKLLLLPAIGAISMLALCALVSVLLLRANAELEDISEVRFANYAAAIRFEANWRRSTPTATGPWCGSTP